MTNSNETPISYTDFLLDESFEKDCTDIELLRKHLSTVIGVSPDRWGNIVFQSKGMTFRLKIQVTNVRFEVNVISRWFRIRAFNIRRSVKRIKESNPTYIEEYLKLTGRI